MTWTVLQTLYCIDTKFMFSPQKYEWNIMCGNTYARMIYCLSPVLSCLCLPLLKSLSICTFFTLKTMTHTSGKKTIRGLRQTTYIWMNIFSVFKTSQKLRVRLFGERNKRTSSWMANFFISLQVCESLKLERREREREVVARVALHKA